MKKFKELFENISEAKSVWGKANDNSMVKNYRAGLLVVIAAKNDFRADIQDKQGHTKKMGKGFTDWDEFVDFIADEFGLDWRVKDAELLNWLDQYV
ncbi:MAG: hypothetical protein J7L15_03255 [Clostridiales bacterium]|nr:hypothetical protein [Clostridiales bacterium]